MFLLNRGIPRKSEVDMIISFAGHCVVFSKSNIKEIVKHQIRHNIVDSQHIVCYLGGYGDFDEICAQVCRELKQEYADIELVYVTPYIDLCNQSKIKEMQTHGLYDTFIYPHIENVPPRFAILKRNEWMITNSDILIAYVEHNYGGAYKSLQIAKRNKKKTINICDFL